jgi:pSer/pThr/pTyr-binding forkhead associated (FHA) protein
MFDRASGLAPGADFMPTLRSLSGGPDIPLNHPLVLVGRHPACDATIDSQMVSLRHCILSQDADEVVVMDLDSTNGTWINGRRVERGRLKLGDEMVIGRTPYRVEDASEH